MHVFDALFHLFSVVQCTLQGYQIRLLFLLFFESYCLGLLPLFLFLFCLFLLLLVLNCHSLFDHVFATILESWEVSFKILLLVKFIFCIYLVSSFIILKQILPVFKSLIFIEGINSLLFLRWFIFCRFWSQIRCVLSG